MLNSFAVWRQSEKSSHRFTRIITDTIQYFATDSSLLSARSVEICGKFFLASIYLAAFGPVEHDPDRQVVAEVFKAMLDAGPREYHIVGAESLA